MADIKPAPITAEHTHGWWIWRAYNIGTGYDVYRESVPGSCAHPSRRFVGSYRTKFFANRAVRNGRA